MSFRIPRGAPVTVVYATGPVPVLTRGIVGQFEGEGLDIELDDDVEIPVGARVILDLPHDAGAPRAIVEVRSHEGRLLSTRLVRIQASDKREYPRLQGSVALRYRVARNDADGGAWMRGDDVPTTERVPDAFMNFSATGLAFDDGAFTKENDLLLCHFSLPGDATAWRCTARVVRVWPIPIDERDGADELEGREAAATHRIAIFFESIPESATTALTRYTIRIQDAILEGPQ